MERCENHMVTDKETQDNILEVKNLKTSFFTDELEVKAVDGVTFSLPRGKTVGLVGESGSGKSITSLSTMRLIDKPGKIVDGEILFNGENLLNKSEGAMRQIRGKEILMIFQKPNTSLNPTFNGCQQISEIYKNH